MDAVTAAKQTQETEKLPELPEITVKFKGNRKDLKITGFVTVHGEFIQLQRVEYIKPESELVIDQSHKAMIVERWYLSAHEVVMVHVEGDMPT